MKILKIKNGKVEIHDERGVLKRVINCKDAVTAIFVGELIQINRADGKVELRDQLGVLKRVM